MIYELKQPGHLTASELVASTAYVRWSPPVPHVHEVLLPGLSLVVPSIGNVVSVVLVIFITSLDCVVIARQVECSLSIAVHTM